MAGGNPNMIKGAPSVNPVGRPKGRFRPITDALVMELQADPKRARRIARRLLQMSEEGHLPSTTFVAERIEGKAVQSLEIGEPGAFMDQRERTARIMELQATVIEEAMTVPLLPTGVKK